MAVKLTEHQLMIVNGMVDIAKATANQLIHIMENHGLDKVEGFSFKIEIDPEFELIAKNITIGSFQNMEENKAAGYCHLVAGKDSYEYSPISKNSPEYEWLFAHPALKERMRKIMDAGAHPLPDDGLWIGSDYNSGSVDSGEWDINDSLS